MKELSLTRKQVIIDKFNRMNPIGTKVYLKHDNGKVIPTVTRSRAAILSGHTMVIWLEGISGCYALDRVWPRALGVCPGSNYLELITR